MTIRLLLFITLLCTISTTWGLEGMIDFQELVDKVNSNPSSTWKADTYGYAYLSEFKLIETKLGVSSTEFNLTDFKKKEKPKNTNLKKIINLIFNFNFIPTSYDAREAHPECDSIKLIRDQGICGTGWAISAASTLSDRTCIWSKGKFNEMLSSNYILGCNHPWIYSGGIKEAWTFLQQNGCITGGEFGSDEGCQPYTIYSCDWPTKIPCSPPYSVSICNIIKPECKGIVCSNKFYSFNETNIVKASKIYRIGDPDNSLLNEFKIREEIFYNGPVQAGFWVHKDFLTYKSGIYRREFDIYDPPLGVHSVKIIGWGEENELKYWLVSNSWGEEWGENGLFRIIRGEDNCFIEHEVWAGIPILP